MTFDEGYSADKVGKVSNRHDRHWFQHLDKIPDTKLAMNLPVLSFTESQNIAVIEPIFAELLYGIRKPKGKELVLS